MPIPGIQQPKYIHIDASLRLRRFDGVFAFAYDWYQDTELLKLIDGIETPYSMERLTNMYTYLNRHGELYFIENRETDASGQDAFVPIGDVTFWQEDMPIVIGVPSYRGRGIGRKVLHALVQRGRRLGYDTLHVNDIYDYNIASRKCFESVGFEAYEKTDTGHQYRLSLSSKDKENSSYADTPPSDWSKLTRKNVDIPAFLRRIEIMKQGGTTKCPFCPGMVSLTEESEGLIVFACDSCDMNFRFESHTS